MPRAIKKIAQAAVRFEKGIGRGKARNNPKKQIISPFAIFIAEGENIQTHLGWIKAFIFPVRSRTFLAIFCKVRPETFFNKTFLGSQNLFPNAILKPMKDTNNPKNVDAPGI